MRFLTKREIINELFAILAMCDGFTDQGSMVGGKKKKEMIEYLPKMIAIRIMDLQDLIDSCKIGELEMQKNIIINEKDFVISKKINGSGDGSGDGDGSGSGY